MPTLADLPDLCETAIAILTRRRAELAARPCTADARKLDALIDGFKRSAQAAAAFEGRLAALGELARTMFEAMAFDFLFDPERELLSIGYRVADGSLDPNYYDLLASEARLASFVAIAKGDLPTRHWFRLGRALAPVGYGSALISWSGSMFEYLMPSLVMRAPAGSLLEQTSRQVVRQQMKYGARRGVPWGASESAYNARDLELTYQYSSFGIPDLGLKRGLGDNTVIAPYATALAAMVDPQAAARNFVRLAEIGGRGRYGWYEALDYTKSAPPRRHRRRRRSRLHGASPGNERDRDRRCASRRGDARALSCRADHPGDRTPASGTNAARCGDIRTADRDRGSRGRGRRAGIVDTAPVQFAARPHPAHAPPLERQICGDDHRGGFGIQPVAGHRGHAMAGGRHLRSAGAVTFSFAICAAARCGRRAISRAGPSRTVTRSLSPRAGPKSSGTTERSRRRWKWRSHRRTTRRFAVSRSPTSAARFGKSS